MGETAPLVSYIVVNWRTEQFLKRALDSIYAQTHPNREVILVDNASPDFDPELVQNYPGLKLIRNEANRGFAAANNQGISASSGEIVVLLNADAMLDSGFSERAIELFAADPRIGTIVPKILRDDASGRIDSAGHRMYEDRTAAHIGKDELEQGQYDYPREVFGGTAAAIAYRSGMIDVVAGGGQLFDESFFAYFEDVDVDWRANLAGYRAVYDPRCVALHRGHGSGGRASLLIQLLAEKNRYLMLAKNDSALALRKIIPLVLYEAYHLLSTVLRPWVWPSLALYLWYLPDAVGGRATAPRTGKGVERTAAFFRPRGLQPPDPQYFPATTAETATVGTPGLTSVIVLNFNGLEQTLQCLSTIRDQTASNLEVIVVDNGSARDEASVIRRRFPRCKVLRTEQNHGFAGGVNWGMTLATGEHIVLVNNDCLLEPECIERLVATLSSSEHAAVSGRLVDLDSWELVTEASSLASAIRRGGSLPATVSPAIQQAVAESTHNHGYSLFGYIVRDAFGSAKECFYPSGGLMAIRRSAIPLSPQLFPHRYFAYHEDAWLGFNLRARGMTVGKEPAAVAIHRAGSTARSLGRVKLRYLQERNRWLNLLGWLPGDVIWKLLLMYLKTNVLTFFALLIRPADLLGWLGAQLWLLTHPLELLKWRSVCRKTVTVENEPFTSALSGAVRGRGGLLNAVALWWCKVTGITVLEDRGKPISGAKEYGRY